MQSSVFFYMSTKKKEKEKRKWQQPLKQELVIESEYYCYYFPQRKTITCSPLIDYKI